MNTLKFLAITFLVSCGAMTAQADDALDGKIEVFVVHADAQGKEILADASIAKPGEVLEYVLTYKSNAEMPLSDVVISAPVPAGSEYIDGSARADAKTEFEASIDNGQSWQAEPLMRLVKTETGVREETVDPAEYSSVRWKNQVALQPDETRKFRYRVRVSNEDS